MSPPHPESVDAQDSGVSSCHPGYADHLCLLVDSGIPANDTGRGALAVCPGAGRDHSISTLLRIHLAAGSPRTARPVHGLCIPADRNWVLDRRMVQPGGMWCVGTGGGVGPAILLRSYDKIISRPRSHAAESDVWDKSPVE